MNCKNCKSSLKSDSTFCGFCGAKIIQNRLTFNSLFGQFSEQFLNYDNKFLQTFIALFKNPELVIGGYINGTRKKYVNVISYFAIAVTLSGLQIYIINKFFPEFIDFSLLTTEGNEGFSEKAYLFTSEYQSIMMMFTVPLYAIMSRIVFLKNKKFNYSEHLVIFMYVLAQISIIGILLQLVTAFFGFSISLNSIILFFFQLIYSAYCLKRLFGLTLKKIILKTLLFLLILIVFIISFSIVYIIIMINIYGGIEEFFESQKAVSYIASFSKNWTS